MTWFTNHRKEWIAETVRIFGFVNRVHIMRKFGVSMPQAAIDLAQFQRENPGLIRYNKSEKRYELC